MRTPRKSLGMTMVEAAVSVAILASIAGGVAGVMRASGGLSRQSRANQIASQHNRRALERITNALRSASLDSLSGFDGSGLATAPQFQPVTATVGGLPVLGTSQTIQWYSQKDPCGAANAGRIDVVKNGVRTCLADRVQSGGFRVALSGSTLKVFLTTYTPTAQGGLINASGEASVTIRN